MKKMSARDKQLFDDIEKIFPEFTLEMTPSAIDGPCVILRIPLPTWMKEVESAISLIKNAHAIHDVKIGLLE